MIAQVTGWEPPYKSQQSGFISRYYSAYVAPALLKKQEKEKQKAANKARNRLTPENPTEPAPLIRQKFSPTTFSRRPDFYETPEWRAVRYERLKINNRSCQCCGSIGGSRKRLGGGQVIIHVDHIKPRNLYPELCLTLSNTQVLCEDCNMGKGSVDQTDWR